MQLPSFIPRSALDANLCGTKPTSVMSESQSSVSIRAGGRAPTTYFCPKALAMSESILGMDL